ncbi:MAG: hypothetical protein HZA32_17710 [Opitutae bacterium]|nr:hypothetical protein [Opitutae bacterium]
MITERNRTVGLRSRPRDIAADAIGRIGRTAKIDRLPVIAMGPGGHRDPTARAHRCPAVFHRARAGIEAASGVGGTRGHSGSPQHFRGDGELEKIVSRLGVRHRRSANPDAGRLKHTSAHAHVSLSLGKATGLNINARLKTQCRDGHSQRARRLVIGHANLIHHKLGEFFCRSVVGGGEQAQRKERRYANEFRHRSCRFRSNVSVLLNQT